MEIETSGRRQRLGITFRAIDANSVQIESMALEEGETSYKIRDAMSHAELQAQLFGDPPNELHLGLLEMFGLGHGQSGRLRVSRDRCFLDVDVDSNGGRHDLGPLFPTFERHTLLDVLHVAGLRGNPQRAYGTAAVGARFPGPFEAYTASMVFYWQQKRAKQWSTLCGQLEALGLAPSVEARQLDASQIELQVSRLPRAKRGGTRDLVNIADVGFGVSQVLPVLVALLTAEPGRLVYIEQPELHLHPRAQVLLAEVLADAANRGVRVVAETHSSHLLLGVQTLVASGKLAPAKVKLHWFQRQPNGLSKVTSADLDETGAYGEWPEDFGDVELQAQDRYFRAVEKVLKVRS